MPFYTHRCNDCEEISELMYSMSKDPKEVECPKCGSTNTERLIGKIHIGWDRKIYKPILKGEEERAEAASSDHMGPSPYSPLPQEQEFEG